MKSHELWLRAIARSQSPRLVRSRVSERGASAVEYGLMIAGIAALIVVVVFAFGDNLQSVFDETCKSVAGGGTCTKD